MKSYYKNQAKPRKRTIKMFHKEIINLLNMSNNTINKLENDGVDLENICYIFKSRILTMREKRNYLYGLEYDEFIKDRIWEGYMGDIETSFFKWRLNN